MTVIRLLRLAKELSPSNFSDETILMWISQVENTLASDITEVEPTVLPEITVATNATMLVPHPYDRVYLPYVQAQIAYAQGETDLYSNYITLYNAYRDEWLAWVLNGEYRNSKYYVSAYALAVEHGYVGTIEQWLESLHGEKGEKGDSVVILGHFDTLELLEQEHPAGRPGDYYEVGLTADTALVYYWDNVAEEWHGIDIVDGQRKAREAAAQAQGAASMAETAAGRAEAAAQKAEAKANAAETDAGLAAGSAETARAGATEAGMAAARAETAAGDTERIRDEVTERFDVIIERTEAVPGLITDVGEISDAVFEKTEVPPKTWTESELREIGYVEDGKFARYDTGSTSGNALYSMAKGILVEGYDRLRYSRISIPSGQTYAGMHFKNRSGGYVGGEQRLTGELGYVESVIEIPEDAAFAYVSIRTDLGGWYAVLESDEIKTDKIAALDERLTAVEQESGKIPEIEERLTAVEQGYEPHVSHVGGDKISNASIRCVKEISYEDGTAPTVHYYVVQDVTNSRFYKTVDFRSFYPLFEFIQGNPMQYKFGVLDNDDIIAVFRTESLTDLETHSDDVRRNPIVFKAAEGYEAHLVDFGTSLKPSGWLSSVGFKTLPTGETLFCEYTRPSVATANAWKITGDAADPGNWRVVKSFNLSGEEHNGFKHCHAIMHDHYTGTIYLTTGDDNVGASVWASTDKGENWRKLTISDPQYNEKYFRILNYTFLRDYVYWSTDSGKTAYHYIFRAPRDEDGIVDYSQVEDLIHLPEEADYYATYGTAYIPELDMILLVERSDANTNESVPVRAYLIEENRLVTLGHLEAIEGRRSFLGFRTEYTEYYPEDGRVKFGFGPRFDTGSYINGIRGFGNSGRPQSLEYNVNNLYLKPFCVNGRYGFRLGTCIK